MSGLSKKACGIQNKAEQTVFLVQGVGMLTFAYQR